MAQSYDSRQYKLVYDYLMSQCSDEKAAREITQSVFFTAAHKRSTEGATGAEYEAWLLGVAKDELINYRVAHRMMQK